MWLWGWGPRGHRTSQETRHHLWLIPYGSQTPMTLAASCQVMNGQRLLIPRPEEKGGWAGEGRCSQSHASGPQFTHSFPLPRQCGLGESDRLGFQCYFPLLPAVWPWAPHLTGLNFHFLLCITEIIAA